MRDRLLSRETFTASAAATSNPLCVVYIASSKVVPTFAFVTDKAHMSSFVGIAEIATILEASTRGSDVVGRYGGDEFLMLLADTTAFGAQQVIDRINDKLEEWNDADHLEGVRVSLCIGISEWHDGQTLDEVLDAADQRMYGQKNEPSVSVA